MAAAPAIGCGSISRLDSAAAGGNGAGWILLDSAADGGMEPLLVDMEPAGFCGSISSDWLRLHCCAHAL